jgi:insertion element IS1 protein InsB
MVAGDRSEATARALWEALPEAYRDEALFCTGFRAAYAAVLPAERHAPGEKGDGLTNHVERFFGTPAPALPAVRAQDAVVLQVRREPHRLSLVLHPTRQRVIAVGPSPAGAI